MSFLERLVSASIACSLRITRIEKRLCNIRVIEIAFPSVAWIIREWKAKTICAIDLVDTNELSVAMTELTSNLNDFLKTCW